MVLTFTIDDNDGGEFTFTDDTGGTGAQHRAISGDAIDRMLGEIPRTSETECDTSDPYAIIKILRQIELPGVSPEREYMIKFFEDLISAALRLYNDPSVGNVTHVLWDFTRARTGTSTYTTIKKRDKVVKKLFDIMTSKWKVQASADGMLQSMRGLLTTIDIIETSDIARKFQEFVCFLLAGDIFGMANKFLSIEEFAFIFRDYQNTRYKSKLGFIRGTLEFLITTYERLKAWRATGDITSILISSDAATIFLKDAAEVVRLSASFGNLSAVGWTEPDYTRLLLHVIDYGESIVAYVGVGSSPEKRYIMKKLQELKLIRDSHLTADAAAQFRQEPYSAMIFGHAGVGKTQFMAMSISQINRVLGFRDTEDNVYVFSPGLKHHDGYRSGKVHCIYDDGASENVNKVQFGSGSTLETPIQAVNTAPWILPMAALEKKGKVRFDPEFVWMTTNVIDMNARHMFSSELALRRRFPVVVEVRVKPEYATNGMLDPQKVPPLLEGERQNTWLITIYRVAARPADRFAVQEALLIHEADFTEIEDFMQWLTRDVIAFRKKTNKAATMRTQMRNVELCYRLENGVPHGCFKSKRVCTCEAVVQMDAAPEMGFDFHPPAIDVNQQAPDRRDRRTPNMRPTELLHLGAEPEVVEEALALERAYLAERTPELAERTLNEMPNLPRELVQHVTQYIGRQRSSLRQWWRDPQYAFWPSEAHPWVQMNWFTRFMLMLQFYFWQLAWGFVAAFIGLVLVLLYDYWLSGRPWDAQDQPSVPGQAGIKLFISFVAVSPLWVTFLLMCYLGYLYYTDLIFRTAIKNFWMFMKITRQQGISAATGHILGLCIQDVGRRFEERLSRILPNDTIIMLSYLSASLAIGYYGGKLLGLAINTTTARKKKKKKVEPVPSETGSESESETPSSDSSKKSKSSPRHVRLVRRRPVVKRLNLVEGQRAPRIQGETGTDMVVKTNEVKVNPWYKESVELTPVHFSRTSLSWKAFAREELLKRLESNIYDIHVRKEDRWVNGTMFGVHENYFIICKHFLAYLPTQLRYSQSSGAEGIRSSREIQIDETQTYFLDGEIVVVFLPDLPMVKSCLELLPRETFPGSQTGHLLTRRKGEYKPIYSDYVSFLTTAPELPGLDGLMHHYGRSELREVTIGGDCGSPLLVHTPFGPTIYGIHVMGIEGKVRHASLAQYLDYKAIKGVVESRYGHLTLQDTVLELSSESVERRMEPLHYKSPVRYIEQGCGYVYGSISGHRGKPKSRVCETLFYHRLIRDGYEDKYGPPVLTGWEPKHQILKAATDKVKSNWLQQDLDVILQAYIAHIERHFPEAPIFTPLTLDEAINGINGVAFIDAMPKHTSTGFPWNKCKKYFLIQKEDGRFTLDEETQRCFERIVSCLEQGVAWEPVMTASLKDELRKHSKIWSKSTRVFYGSHFVWAIVGRMLLLPLIAFIQNHTEVFCMYPGTNVSSRQWEALCRHLTKFASVPFSDLESFEKCDALINDGDFGKFDVTMDPKCLSSAGDFFFWMCRWGSYTDKASLMVRGVLKPIVNPYVNFFGDLLRFVGINPSGHIATVIVNCLVSIFSLMNCYLLLNPEGTCDDFFDHVALATYGDDNIMGISPSIPWFSHLTIASKMRELGLEYTMAEKDAAPVPYQSITKASFLKRYFRYDPDVGAVLAPLHEDSIVKSLMKCVRSKSVTLEEQNIDAVEAAVSAYFHYGKDKFEKMRRYLMEIVEDEDLTHRVKPSTFPTWDTLVERFESA